MSRPPLGPHGRRRRAAQLRALIQAAEAELDALGQIDGPIVKTRTYQRATAVIPYGASTVSAARIRGWARAQGLTVPMTGKVSNDLRYAYAAAHPEEPTAS